MKKFIRPALVMLTLAALVVSCGKYEEGPAFSLLTKKARLSGEWVVEEAEYNGVNVTSEFVAGVGANFVLEIEKDGEYRTEGPNPDKGSWELGEDKDDIFFLSDAEGSTEVSYRILRLKNKELWLKHTETNGDIIEVKYKSKG